MVRLFCRRSIDSEKTLGSFGPQTSLRDVAKIRALTTIDGEDPIVDINKLIARAKAIVTQPKTEWPVIAGEPATVSDLYKNYIILLAAAPVIASFIKGSLIGTTIPFAGTVRTPIGAGLLTMVLSYALALASVFVMALIVDALAPTFSAQKDRTQAVKTIAYSSTAAWVAGIAVIVPAIGWLVALAGAIYSIYLLYVGLPHTMKAPQEKAAGYTAVTIIIAIILYFIVGAVIGTVAGVGMGLSGAGAYSSRNVAVDKDSPLGRLEQWGKEVEEASKKLEAAQASGDQAAQEEALKEMMGAAFGGGGAVEALPADRLKPFIPEKLARFKRTDFSVERNSAMGLQITTASATYSDDDNGRTLNLEIVDTAAAKGLLSLAHFGGIEGESESDGISEKVYRDDGRLIREYWDRSISRGEYSVVVGDRFTVKVEGEADDIDDLKRALKSVDLKGLEKLKNEGVKR